jgi:hypothetical protein
MSGRLDPKNQDVVILRSATEECDVYFIQPGTGRVFIEQATGRPVVLPDRVIGAIKGIRDDGGPPVTVRVERQ